LCRVNDRILSANGVPLENVDYSTAVQVLRDSGHTVQLVLKRRVVLPPNNANSNPNVAAPAEQSPQTLRVSLARGKKKDDFGLVLGCRLYVKEVGSRSREDRRLAQNTIESLGRGWGLMSVSRVFMGF